MVLVLSRAFFILLGILLGFYGYQYIFSSYLSHLNYTYYITGIIPIILFLGIIGYFLGGFVGRYLKYLLRKIEEFVRRMPIPDLISSFIGIFLGIIIAVLVYIIGLSQIPLPSMIRYVISVFLSLLIIFLTTRVVNTVYRRKDLILSLRKTRDKISDIKRVTTSDEITAKPKILDTSTIIDGRIYYICGTGFIEGSVIIPKFVIEELQKIADSSEDLKRKRGRRGLDLLHKLIEEENVEVKVIDKDFPNLEGVDSKLVQLAKDMEATIVTNDYNLNKVARLQKVEVLNVNDLSNAVKQIILPGEKINVQVIKEGKEEDQGIAYLDDGTMIVVEKGKKLVGETINVIVKGFLQTPAGRMIFTKLIEKN